MPKYYVSSGDFAKVIDRKNPKTAAVDAFQELEENPVNLGFVTVISEKGFEKVYPEDVVFTTMEILELSDQIANYKLNEWEDLK